MREERRVVGTSSVVVLFFVAVFMLCVCVKSVFPLGEMVLPFFFFLKYYGSKKKECSVCLSLLFFVQTSDFYYFPIFHHCFVPDFFLALVERTFLFGLLLLLLAVTASHKIFVRRARSGPP